MPSGAHKVYAVLPAAGLGTRMLGTRSAAASPGAAEGRAPSKQFAPLAGKPILVHTLSRFAANKSISTIVVALRKSEMDGFTKALADEAFSAQVRVVEGGENRQESVWNGLSWLAQKAGADDIILVHDAVRPFIDDKLISSVIACAEQYGAAIVGLPAVDTIKLVERTAQGAIISSTIPRERVVMAQTPQAFRFGVLKAAFESALKDSFTGTDEASLVERLGHEVAVVMGSPANIKITTPHDMELAEFLVESGRA